MSHRPVRIGMMSFAHMHATSYAHSIVTRPDTEMVGIADHDPARTAEMARRYQTQAFSSYEALLATPDLDAVVICSENVRHRELVGDGGGGRQTYSVRKAPGDDPWRMRRR